MSLTPQQLTTMIQRTLALLALALFALVGQAQSLSPAQVTALRTNILASEFAAQCQPFGDGPTDIASAYNLPASSPSGVFDMSRADRRAGFENPFGASASNPSRVAMRAAWQRNVTRFERIYTAGSGSLAATATSHSILATDTVKGAALLCRSTAGTAPSTTVGSTAGALYSAGLFSGGDKAVANGDTLNVTYTASA